MALESNPPSLQEERKNNVLPFWKQTWFILLLILGVGGAGGYFRFYFHQHHLQIKGFQYLGIQKMGKQYYYTYRHKITGLDFILVPPQKEKGKKKIPAFLMSQDLITWKKIQKLAPGRIPALASNKDSSLPQAIPWNLARQLSQVWGLELPSLRMLQYAFHLETQKGLGLKDFGRNYEWTKDTIQSPNQEIGKVLKIAVKAIQKPSRGWELKEKGFPIEAKKPKIFFRCVYFPKP